MAGPQLAAVTEVLVGAFGNLFEEFLSDISHAYPEYPNFAYFLSGLKMMRLVGKDRYVLDCFMDYVSPYAAKIRQRDESFFLQHTFSDLTAEGGALEEAPGENFITSEIAKIKGIWRSADQTTKDCIYDYFSKLLRIGEAVVKK